MHAKLSRSVQLIEVLIRDGVLSEEELARELVVRPRTIEHYRSGKVPVPLDRQLCLALLMMQMSTEYARLGYQLREQVRGATQYENRLASIHDDSPVRLR